jgi:hypothetical protein
VGELLLALSDGCPVRSRPVMTGLALEDSRVGPDELLPIDSSKWL